MCPPRADFWLIALYSCLPSLLVYIGSFTIPGPPPSVPLHLAPPHLLPTPFLTLPITYPVLARRYLCQAAAGFCGCFSAGGHVWLSHCVGNRPSNHDRERKGGRRLQGGRGCGLCGGAAKSVEARGGSGGGENEGCESADLLQLDSPVALTRSLLESRG